MSEKTPEQIEAERLEAQRKADAQAAVDQEKYLREERKSLIRVKKGDEELYVHPTCVAAHEQLGWTVAKK